MRAMVLTTFLCLLPALGACSKHPLHGGWQQHVVSGSGRSFDFDPDSNKLLVHGVPGADGTHPHYDGTYRLDGTMLAVEWTEGGTKFQWSGELRGDALEFRTDDGKVEFHRGAAEHGH
jgi:hypothetical protein